MPGTVLRRIAPANPQAPTGYSRQRGVVDEQGDAVVADPVSALRHDRQGQRSPPCAQAGERRSLCRSDFRRETTATGQVAAAGWDNYLHRGRLDPPVAVSDARSIYRISNDTIARFIDDTPLP